MIGTAIAIPCFMKQLTPFDPKITMDKAGPQLYWNGEKLILKNSEDQDLKFENTPILPAALRPLFFQKIPINDADIELLMTVPGIGQKLGNAIIEERKQSGNIKSANGLLLIPGIGDKKMRRFKEYFSFN